LSVEETKRDKGRENQSGRSVEQEFPASPWIKKSLAWILLGTSIAPSRPQVNVSQHRTGIDCSCDHLIVAQLYRARVCYQLDGIDYTTNETRKTFHQPHLVEANGELFD